MDTTSSAPLLSVIVPVYKVEEWLRPCLDSICNQTYRNLEIICVNDRSPDNSAAILAEYAARDPRIRIINREKNGGVAAARNSGLDAATGEFITFVDPDDTVDLNAYQDCIAQYRDDVDLVCYGIKTAGPPSQRKANIDRWLQTKKLVGSHSVTLEAIENMSWNIWVNIFRKSIIDSCSLRLLTGIWQDDLDFFFCYLSQCRRVCGIDSAHYHWLIRGDSTSSQDIAGTLNVFIAHEHILQFLQTHNRLDHRSSLVQGVVRNILQHYYALDSSYRRTIIRSIRSLFNKWKLWDVDVRLDGHINYEGALWRLKTPDLLLPLIKLFYICRQGKISYKFLGISVFSIYTAPSPHRYKILGIPFGPPVRDYASPQNMCSAEKSSDHS